VTCVRRPIRRRSLTCINSPEQAFVTLQYRMSETSMFRRIGMPFSKLLLTPHSIQPIMDLPTQAHLKTIRELLTYRLGDLRADVHAAELERQADAAESGQGVVDRKDEAAKRQRVALSGQQEERDRQELVQVEAALRRLDAGNYGDCSSCGEPVPLDRLMVQPAAERCAACQCKFEAHALHPA